MTAATVLAIDDSPEIHTLLKARLRPEDVVLHHAYGAEDGLKMASELRPDLVLLDIDLPSVTGFEVCQRLKADPRTADLQVIFLTGSTGVDDKVQGLELGAVDYVTKPFEAAELRARVRSALRQKMAQDKLLERARIDGLTQVWNRAYFDQHLEGEVLRARADERACALVMVDIDHFKRLNDNYGHPFGDKVLSAVAATLKLQVRNIDAVCRYGGEEFAIVLAGIDARGALAISERIRENIEALVFRPNDELVRVTASLGVSCSEMLRDGLMTRERMIEIADSALYDAKHGGRNQVRLGAGMKLSAS